LAADPGKHLELVPPKTKASLRTVPLPDPVLAALAQHVETFGTGRDDFVFTQRDGYPLSTSTLWSLWHAALQKAGSRVVASTSSATITQAC
jgi:integrase